MKVEADRHVQKGYKVRKPAHRGEQRGRLGRYLKVTLWGALAVVWLDYPIVLPFLSSDNIHPFFL